MRLFVLLFTATILVLPSGALAQGAGKFDADKLRDNSQMQPKLPGRQRNPCADYGAGFAQVPGTSTCAKLGGSISVGIGSGTGGPRRTR